MKSIAAVVLVFVAVVSARAGFVYRDASSGLVVDRPDSIGGTGNPTDEQLFGHGIAKVSCPDGVDRRYWVWDGAGFSSLPAEDIAAIEEADEAAAAEAEAARIAAKPVLLKKAENRFLMALGAFNQQFPANSVLPTDGFLEIGDKLKDSGMPLVDRLELSQTLNAYWDLVLFHGGRFGDIQWHPEPEAFPTDMQ